MRLVNCEPKIGCRRCGRFGFELFDERRATGLQEQSSDSPQRDGDVRGLVLAPTSNLAAVAVLERCCCCA